jgi:hypothetical protein
MKVIDEELLLMYNREDERVLSRFPRCKRKPHEWVLSSSRSC